MGHPVRLSIQEMIDDVLAGTDDSVMSKIAEEAKKDDEKKKASKEEVERQADKEEAQQGGGQTQGAYPEKTASERILKLADAVDEIVSSITGEVPSNVGRVVTAATEEAASNVGPGKGPGASDTNVDSPTPGEQSDVSGEAKTKIPMNPPMESQGSGGNAKAPANAMATNAEMMHPPQPEAGVMKQACGGSLADFTASLLEKTAVTGEILGAVRGARASKAEGGSKKERVGGAIEGVQKGMFGSALGTAAGGAAGLAGGAGLGALIGLAAKKPGAAKSLARQAASLGKGKAVSKELARAAKGATKAEREAFRAQAGRGGGGGAAALERAAVGAGIGGAAGGLGGSVAGDIVGGDVSTHRLKMKAKRLQEGKSKKAEDALNPAQLSAPKAKGLPEDQPSSMKRPAEVTSQEKHVASNEAATAAKKVQTQAVPKKRMGEVLDEPAQTASTDKVLDQALGADKVDQAGAKIAADQKAKVAAARAWLQKIASEGCTCDPDTEECTCQFGKLASRLKKGGTKGSTKTSMFGAGGVPSTVQSSSSGGSMAGGMTPQM